MQYHRVARMDKSIYSAHGQNVHSGKHTMTDSHNTTKHDGMPEETPQTRIPHFNEHGLLPPGMYESDYDEFMDHFAHS